MGLQDELDAYDRHQRDLEERLDAKTAELIRAQRGALTSPSKVSFFYLPLHFTRIVLTI